MDPQYNLKLAQSGAPQSVTDGAVTGAWFDASNYKDVIGAVAVGAVSAGGTVNAKLQHSDDQSSIADVADATITEIDGDGDNAISTLIKYRRHAGSAKKYVRLVITVTGTALIAGVLIGANPAQAPV